MFCKLVKSKSYYMVLMITGVMLAAIGIIGACFLPEDAHNMSRLMGIFTGIGSSFIGVGAVRLLRNKMASPDKLKQEQINKKDERNVQILRVSYTTVAISSTITFALLVILFTIMGSITESYICLAALLLQVLIFTGVYRYFYKIM